jgi:hypothetical protein
MLSFLMLTNRAMIDARGRTAPCRAHLDREVQGTVDTVRLGFRSSVGVALLADVRHRAVE